MSQEMLLHYLRLRIGQTIERSFNNVDRNLEEQIRLLTNHYEAITGSSIEDDFQNLVRTLNLRLENTKNALESNDPYW
ncbi:MAG: hypothetical protein GWN01_00690 [Nitrosopumilaceae archaeon]|nr:hypothetical protein [Nitrosopumilaceae archaeon]NIT99497.1 hypothetical protein [Nitrosopumilaceae archaeon]NIU85856.1 hypothetical protein [Nitrosopumilaceae archaeon]NIV64713.1 hypothetical protein [Nitrosopumilaceae archaeon]NIX60100.1 hypothetical protein [Nitrosopumilaceae archaeon]